MIFLEIRRMYLLVYQEIEIFDKTKEEKKMDSLQEALDKIQAKAKELLEARENAKFRLQIIQKAKSNPQVLNCNSLSDKEILDALYGIELDVRKNVENIDNIFGIEKQ